MSGYKTHTAFNLGVTLPATTIAIYYLWHPPYAFFLCYMATFVYATLFMNPDLDLAHQIKLFSLRGLFSLPFRLYSRVFRHRGLSHSPLLGSATRILWLAGLFLLFTYLFYQTMPSEKDLLLFYKKYKFFILYSLAGICLADWSHLLLDFRK